MSASVDEVEFIDCACYTHGRRHPEVLGSLGLTKLPFQVTGPALGAFFVTGLVMVGSWVKGGWWTWLLPTPLNAMLCVVVPIAMGVVSQYARVDGRNPFVGGWAFARYGFRSRHGMVAGRTAPPSSSLSDVGSRVRVRETAVRSPIRAVVGNLVWNRAGQVWAIYAVDPVGAMHQSHSQRIKVFNRLRAAFMRLPTEAHLLSIGETIDPFDTLTATLPVDGRLSTLGRDLQERYEGYLTSQRSVRRTHYIALLLDRVATSEWRSQLDAGMASVTETLGATTMPSPKAVRRCEARADEIVAKFGSLRLQPVSAGRVRWLSARLLARGVDDVMFDESWEPRTGTASTSLTGPFQEVRFAEGGSGDDEGRGRLGRYVRCDNRTGFGVSHLLGAVGHADELDVSR